MKKFVFICVACGILLLLALPCFALDAPAISSQSAYLADRESGKVLFEKQADKRITMGTFAKVLVTLLALEKIPDLSVQIPVSDVAYNNAQKYVNDGPSAYLKKGEVLTADQLLKLLSVRSAMDASNALAEYIAGSLTEFVVMLNEKAAALGCADTNFVNACGAENPQQYTTAHDMYLILKAALETEGFEDYAYLTVANVNEHHLTTSNSLTLSSKPDYYYSSAKGIAYTQLNDNTNSVATLLCKGSAEYICVVMGGGVSNNLKTSFLDAKTLGEWVFSAFKTVTLAKKGDIVASVPLALCEQSDKANLVAAEDITALVPIDCDEKSLEKTVVYTFEDQLFAPIKKGDILAKVTYAADGVDYAQGDLSAMISYAYSEKLAKELSRREFMRSPVFIIIVVVAVLVLAGAIAVGLTLYKRNHVDGIGFFKR